MKEMHENDGFVEEALASVMKTDIPPEVRGRLHRHLAAFRGRLDAEAEVGRVRTGFAGRMVPVLSAAATVAVVIGALLAVFGGTSKPTWAQVRERFDSIEFFSAAIYVKADATSEPVQLDLWMGYGGRLRMRAGNHVIFGEKGQPTRSIEFASASDSTTGLDQARHMIEQIVGMLGEEETFSLDTLIRVLRMGNRLSAPLENQNLSISDDLVVFDITSDQGPEWVRVWALRESRLPVRVLYWNPRSTDSVDVVLSYASMQTPEFFDPEAYEANLAQSNQPGPWEAYGLFLDPGGRPISPEDARRWQEMKNRREQDPAQPPGSGNSA